MVIGACLALVVVKVRRFGIIVCGAAGGFFVGILSNYFLLHHIKSTPSNLFFNNSLFIFAILGAMIGNEYKDHIIILSTSLIGSYITIRTISIIFGNFPNELTFNAEFNIDALTHYSWIFYIYLILIVLLFGVGVFF